MGQSAAGHSRILPSLVLLGSISLACSDSGGATPEAGVSGTRQVEQADFELGPGSFDYSDPSAGLDGLSSFKATLTVSFDGTEGGQARQWSNTTVLIYQSEPRVRILTFETTATGEDPPPALRAEMNGVEYEQATDETCTARPLDGDDSVIDSLSPVIALVGVLGAEQAGQEAVDGTETDHYKFDERALGQAGLVESSGELWVASQGGYLVRYLLTAEAGEHYFGDGTAGVITWDYELSEVNQVAAVQLPEGCPAGMVDAPQLPDAVVVTNMPGLLQYETAASVAEVVAFYDQELPTRGWTVPAAGEVAIPEGMSPEEYELMLEMIASMGLGPDGGSTPAAEADNALLAYEQGAMELDVFVFRGDTSTKVVIALRNSSESA